MSTMISEAQTQTSTSSSPLTCLYVITYDGKRFLEKCFDSLQKLTDYSNHRLVLVDNGSSDGSGDYVREHFPEVEVLRIFPNAGYANAANKAVEHARANGAEYVVLMNDDIEILHAHWLTEAVAQAERDPQLGIIGFVETTPEDTESQPPQSTLFEVDYLRGFAMLMPLSLFNGIGDFDEIYFVVGDEDDLGARAQRAGYKLVKLGIPIYHFGGGTNQNYGRTTAFRQMRNGIRFSIKNRSLLRAFFRSLRILDVACNPWPLSLDLEDAAHMRMRNSGNVLVNLQIWARAVIWNLWHLRETLSIRTEDSRRAAAVLAERKHNRT